MSPKSKSHLLKDSSQGTRTGEEDKAIIKQLPPRRVEKNDPAQLKGSIDEESEDEWVEVDSDEDLADEDMNSCATTNRSHPHLLQIQTTHKKELLLNWGKRETSSEI